jgi:hypothetical protein
MRKTWMLVELCARGGSIPALGGIDSGVTMMHLYLRLLRAETEEEYSDDERQHLHDLLSVAPGVQRVKGVKRHPRGGYDVTLDVNRESLDALFEYLPAQGLMACL